MNFTWPRSMTIGLILLAASAAGAQQRAAPHTKPAPQSVSPVPQATTATYGDWVLRCTRSAANEAQRICEVAETLEIQGKGPVAQIAIGRVSQTAPLLASVVLPLNVSFPSTVRLSIDEKDREPADLAWKRCLPSGCYADTEIKEGILRRWRAQTARGRLQFKEGDGRDVLLPFSFRGLAQALDAMSKA